MFLISICTLCVFFVLLLGSVQQKAETIDFSYGTATERKFVISKSTYIAFALVLIITSTLRFGFIDTYAYKDMYILSRGDLSYVKSAPFGVEAWWLYFCYGLNFISGSPKLLLFVCSAIIVGAMLVLIKKYSVDPLISMILFFSLNYLDTNNGLRQMVASAIVILAFPLLEKRKVWAYIVYILAIFVASKLHSSAVICYAIFFIILGKPFNPKIFLVFLAGILFIAIPDYFTEILSDLFEDNKYINYLDMSNGMSGMRALITGVIPAILTIWYLLDCRKKSIDIDRNEALLINMLIVDSVFVFMGYKMQYWARMGFYTNFSGIILIPKYIEQIFGDKTRNLVKIIVIVCYFVFFAYNVYVNFSYGALDQFYPSWN